MKIESFLFIQCVTHLCQTSRKHVNTESVDEWFYNGIGIEQLNFQFNHFWEQLTLNKSLDYIFCGFYYRIIGK